MPQRYILALMTCLATLSSYTMRTALSIGITEMVIKKNETLKNHSDACPIIEEHKYVTVKNKDVLYDWDETTQGLILGSFYWGYIITHIPSALVAEKLGGKHVLNVGMFITSFFTVITPGIVKSTQGDWIVLVVMRFIIGLAQGVLYPVATALLAQWVPPKEKGVISSISFAGGFLGNVAANALSGVLITATKDWGIIFYFFGSFGLVWCVAWQLICYSYPRTHPCIKEKELEFLEETLGQDVSKTVLKTPWKSIVLSLPVWAYTAAQFGHDWGWFMMAIDLPKYMNAVLRFNVQENGVWSAFPYFVMFFSAISSGILSDYFIEKKNCSTTLIRIIWGTIGTTGPAIFLLLASYVGCDRILAVACFTIGMTLMGPYYSGIKLNALDLSPNFAGTLMAITNGLGVFAGMLAPAVVGYLAPNQTLFEWRLIFWVNFGIMEVTNVIYALFMSGNVQKWNNPHVEENI